MYLPPHKPLSYTSMYEKTKIVVNLSSTDDFVVTLSLSKLKKQFHCYGVAS